MNRRYRLERVASDGMALSKLNESSSQEMARIFRDAVLGRCRPPSPA